MIHLGDITKISGYEVPIVDCVIGGSPCQDLSVAGKRAGLAGERSGLYMEQIRIIKEMREQDVRNNGRADRPVRPRYMVWENVPGAFSSNKGKDFAAVLEEAIRIAEPEAPDVPVPPKGWPTAGSIMGDGWSIAWRTHDAQYWGVPQRRKRISLIADFGGRTAPEILFECKSMPRNSEQSGEKGKRTSERTEGSTSSTKCYAIGSYHSNAWLSTNPNSGVYEAETSRTLDALNCGYPGCNQGGMAVVQTFDARGNGDGKTVCTITGDHENRITDYTALCVASQFWDGSQTASTLTANNANGSQRMPDKENFNCVITGVDCRNATENDELCATLQAKPGGGFSYNCIHPVRINGTVRRLTPLECERLQGFPDGWTDIGEWIDSKGKKHDSSDSARYKALENSIALPFWRFLCKRISAQYARKATMASLFDGIGGFPLVWEEWNGKGSAVWASEIEEFPIAVTKYHFGEG